MLTWTHVTAVYDPSAGFSIYLDGVQACSKPASGLVKDAGDLDLYVGMAHQKQFPWAYEREITKRFLRLNSASPRQMKDQFSIHAL